MKKLTADMIGERVFVYKNLHKNCYSVKSLKTNRVIAHTDTICLLNVSFRVGKAGRMRVLKEKRKNVHAGIVGIVTSCLENATTEVTYNPYKYNSFVIKSNEAPVFSADKAQITLTGIKI